MADTMERGFRVTGAFIGDITGIQLAQQKNTFFFLISSHSPFTLRTPASDPDSRVGAVAGEVLVAPVLHCVPKPYICTKP